MKRKENAEIDSPRTFDNESFVLENFRLIPFYQIKYLGRRINCFRIKRLIRSFFFSKSWENSFSKGDPSPDFHNEKHRVMMEVMRVDDAISEPNDKCGDNSFKRTKRIIKAYFGQDYKGKLKNCSVYINPDTRNDKEYNIYGYLKTFKRVVMDHSNKIDNYHKHYPRCKTCIFLICDESNGYYQVVDKNRIRPHLCFTDKNFIEVIKNCRAEYVVWFVAKKESLMINNKELKQPLACIYDVKHFKESGIEYDYEKMVKIK